MHSLAFGAVSWTVVRFGISAGVGRRHKKAELSQSGLRDTPYIRVPWKFSGVPDYAHGYFSRNF